MMNVRRGTGFAMLALLGSVLGPVDAVLAAGPVTNANELLAQHLDSIASSSVRAGLKTRVVQGLVHFKFVVGGSGGLDGKAVLVSDGEKFQFMMKLPNNQYDGEQIIFDGRKDSVAFSMGRQSRSAFGNFVFVQDAVIRDGLLGGTLSTAWPLLSLDERKAEIKFDGLKKIEGQQLYRLSYRPHKSTDLKIELYFDPETFRHVETIYELSAANSMASLSAQAQQRETHYQLQEKFSDFKTVDGVTLPTHYNMQFSRYLQNSRNEVFEWDMTGLEASNNMPVDARNFEVK
jgi:hypothetical protein